MLQTIVEAAKKLWELLPKDPFMKYLLEVSEFMQQQPFVRYLNYFVPVRIMVEIGTAWLSAVSVYIIVRKVRAALFGKG